jgi:hypothetical protein
VAFANALVSAVALIQKKEVVDVLTATEEVFDVLGTFAR